MWCCRELCITLLLGCSIHEVAMQPAEVSRTTTFLIYAPMPGIAVLFSIFWVFCPAACMSHFCEPDTSGTHWWKNVARRFTWNQRTNLDKLIRCSKIQGQGHCDIMSVLLLWTKYLRNAFSKFLQIWRKHLALSVLLGLKPHVEEKSNVPVIWPRISMASHYYCVC